MKANFVKNETKIVSNKTKDTYFLVRPDQVVLPHDAVIQVHRVCQEKEVYENVFKLAFHGRPYSEDRAQWFIIHIIEGWENKSHFHWLIMNKGSIVGTIGIKTTDGEIGYWQSKNHPGVISNALNEVCEYAKTLGFASLWAYVKKDNLASIRVLEKNLFLLDNELNSKRTDALGFRKIV